MLGVPVKVGLKASRKPYIENRFAPYFSRIAQSAGRAISGAKGMDPPAAVGAIVPSSSRSVNDAPRAQYVWKVRLRPASVSVVFAGPSEAVRPHLRSP